MTVERDAWIGELAQRLGPRRTVALQGVLERASSGSGVFKGRTADGRWWVKPVNNLQDPRVPITELVLGRAGALIEAPVCDVGVVRIPEGLAGEEYRDGRTLEPGHASGSRHVGAVVEIRDLQYVDDDDNRRRHAGVFALYDWCWGGDDQWLYASTEANRLYSHDHGHYLPGAPGWTGQLLEQHVDDDHQPQRPWDRLDPDALDGYAERLNRLTHDRIRGILSEVPPEWPIDQTELESLGYFLERRAGPVAGRLQDLARSVRGGQP